MTRLRAADLRAAIAERIGCPVGIADDQLLAALEEALTRRPAGTELIDTEALAELRVEAELGRTSRERGIVDAALRAGKILAKSADSWLTLLQRDPASAEAVLASLPSTIPVGVVGYGVDPTDDADETLLRELYPEFVNRRDGGRRSDT